MALGTVLSEFILVDIRMATCTIGKFNAGKFLEFYQVFSCYRMTLHAGDALVHADKWKPGRGVVEFYHRFERIQSMAVGAG